MSLSSFNTPDEDLTPGFQEVRLTMLIQIIVSDANIRHFEARARTLTPLLKSDPKAAAIAIDMLRAEVLRAKELAAGSVRIRATRLVEARSRVRFQDTLCTVIGIRNATKSDHKTSLKLMTDDGIEVVPVDAFLVEEVSDIAYPRPPELPARLTRTTPEKLQQVRAMTARGALHAAGIESSQSEEKAGSLVVMSETPIMNSAGTPVAMTNTAEAVNLQSTLPPRRWELLMKKRVMFYDTRTMSVRIGTVEKSYDISKAVREKDTGPSFYIAVEDELFYKGDRPKLIGPVHHSLVTLIGDGDDPQPLDVQDQGYRKIKNLLDSQKKRK